MRRRGSATRALLAAAALAGLAGCNDRDERAAAGGEAGAYCKPFRTASDEQPAATPPGVGPGGAPDPVAAVDDCLHRWGYTFAASSDDADLAAEAVVAACTGPLLRWNQQSLAMLARQEGPPPELPSLLTGQPTNPIAEHNAFTRSRALFYVVQARAGRCPRPPVEAPGKAAPVAPPKRMTSPDP